MSSAISYRRLRAPAEHGQALLEPPLSTAVDLLSENCATDDLDAVELQGMSLGQLRGSARNELVQLAIAYTQTYRDVERISQPTSLLMTGHQPELFHPGVWLKNIVLSLLTAKVDGVAVNLLIDSHPLRHAEIVVPTHRAQTIQTERIRLDHDQEPIPYEQRHCLDHEMFASFGQRAADAIRPLVADPMAGQHWHWAREALAQTGNLGQALAQFRHRIEQRIGLSTLEVPLSLICDTRPFWWFASHLLVQAPRFASCYNLALAEYRQAHRTRNLVQPLPDLAVVDGWYETPFWIWSDSGPTRRPLFAKQLGAEVELNDRHGFRRRLPIRPSGSAESAVECWSALRQDGWKLRPRALTTTLFARLVLADLFIHGIGGSKYDQVTDRLSILFWGKSPEPFLTVSATAMLPVTKSQVSVDSLRQVQWQLRDIRFHPEKHFGSASAPTASSAELEAYQDAIRWIEYKRSWTAREIPQGSRRERHEAIEQANAKLQRHVARKRERLEAERAQLIVQLKDERILASREYAFCLFPEEFLSGLLLDLCEQRPYF